MDKVDNMQKQMGNVNQEMKILKNNQKEILEIKKQTNKQNHCNKNEGLPLIGLLV